MALLDNLQSILGGQAQGSGQNQANPLTNLLAPAALGGLMGALMSNKKARKVTGNVLLLGGGAALATVLWNKYKNRPPATPTTVFPQQAVAPAPQTTHSPQPQPAPYGQASAYTQPNPFSTSGFDVQAKARRLVRAMIFAAKSDGVIDASEQQAIQETIHQLQLGQDAEQVINQAMNEPLDPRAVAQGVNSQEEALEVYLVSSSVIEVDHFMESSYLDALARELNIPPELKAEIAAEIEKSRSAVPE